MTDTASEADARQLKTYRRMCLADKAGRVAALNLSVQRMTEAGVRRRFPAAGEREIFLRVAALRNGRELSVAAYGWDPEVEGW